MERCVHFSVDDIGACFRQAYDHEILSLFDICEFGFLKYLREKYGVKCCCYIFEPTDFFEFAIKSGTRVKKDFAENGTWLKFGFHGNKVPFRKDYAYRSEYYLFEYACDILSAEKTDVIRLHNWYATPEQKVFLKAQGVNTLLYPDDSCLRYDDTGEFIDGGLTHRKTDIRIEALESIDEMRLISAQNHIVVFTHEDCLRTRKDDIEKTIKIYSENGYRFI